VERLDISGPVTHVAAGGLGLWVTRGGAHRSDLIQLDPSSGRPLGVPVRLDGRANRLAVGEGAVWAVLGTGVLIKVDPGSGRIVDRVPTGDSVSDMAVGERGVWITHFGPGTVTRIDPRTDRIVATIHVGRGPSSVLVGGGAVWVTSDVEGPILQRIDPASNAITAKRSWGLEAIQDHVLWVEAGWTSNGGLRRVDPTTLLPMGPAIGFDIQPSSVAPAGRETWAGKYLYYCKLHNPIPEGPPIVSFAWYRIDPTTLHALSAPVFTGFNPTEPPVFAGGSLWLSSGGYPQRAVRIDLRVAGALPATPTPGVPSPLPNPSGF
jgi:hypothetical protein